MRVQQAAVAVVMGLIAAVVQADALPLTSWVNLKVQACREVTFMALEHSTAHMRGDSHRTTQITGQVVNAGVDGVDAASSWLAQAAESRKATLPAPGQDVTVVLAEADAAFCQTAGGQVRRFVYSQTCDTLPLRGACLPPHPLVKPVVAMR